MSQPQINDEPGLPSEPPRASWLRVGAAAGALTLLAFAAYAYIAPATYRTSAALTIEPRDPQAALALSPLEAARHLQEAVLDRDVLEQLTTEQAPSFSAEERIQVARTIQRGFQIDSVDGHTFTVSFRDSDRHRAESRCNQLATMAVERAPRVLAQPPTAQRSLQSERRRRVDEISAFLAAHPELVSPFAQSSVKPGTEAHPELLAEIKARVAKQTPPAKASPGATRASPEVAAEWQRQLAELARVRALPDPTDQAVPALNARIISRAAVPSWPIEPDRPMILLWGLAAALSVSVLASAATKAGARSRGFSSFPPPNDELPSLSSAPPLPAAANIPSSSPPARPEPKPSSPDLQSKERSRSRPPLGNGQVAPSAAAPTAGDSRASSSAPPAGPSSASRLERARPALEVNAGSLGPARTTQALGSPIPPIIAPLKKSGSSAPPASAPEGTSYSYVSTPPPVEYPRTSSAPPGPSSAPRSTTVIVQSTPPGWRPDLSLLPELRRKLCDEIYPLAVEQCMVLAVLGAEGAEDKKSRLAAELALGLAETGHPRVLLLEGNLHRPSVHRFLRVEMPLSAGLSDQLESRIEIRTRRPWTVIECSPSLHVLAEGTHSAPELILSRPFEDCVSELRSFYDFIVIDGPSLGDAPSCRAVHDVIDNAVLLETKAELHELSDARSLFPGKRITLVRAAGSV